MENKEVICPACKRTFTARMSEEGLPVSSCTFCGYYLGTFKKYDPRLHTRQVRESKWDVRDVSLYKVKKLRIRNEEIRAQAVEVTKFLMLNPTLAYSDYEVAIGIDMRVTRARKILRLLARGGLVEVKSDGVLSYYCVPQGEETDDSG